MKEPQSARENRGQMMLVATGDSLAKIAEACDVSRPAVSTWKSAKNLPRRKQRDALFQAYGIPFDAWDEELGSGERVPKVVEAPRGRPMKGIPRDENIAPAKGSSSPRKASKRAEGLTPPAETDSPIQPAGSALPPYPPAPKHASTLDSVRHSLECIRHDLKHRPLTAAARSKVRADETRTLALIAKLEEKEELTEDRYVREHPEWQELCVRLLRALEPYPEAAQAVLDAINTDENE